MNATSYQQAWDQLTDAERDTLLHLDSYELTPPVADALRRVGALIALPVWTGATDGRTDFVLGHQFGQFLLERVEDRLNQVMEPSVQDATRPLEPWGEAGEMPAGMRDEALRLLRTRDLLDDFRDE